MWSLSLEWLLLAVLVFWAVGAYTRLKRLRAACATAFQALDLHFQQILALLSEFESQPPAAEGEMLHARHALQPTAALLQSALLGARAKPLQADGVAGLDAAWQALQVGWTAYEAVVAQAAAAAAADSTAQAPAGLGPWSQRWQQLHTLQAHAAQQFNQAVLAYNAAIAQFPACLLAWIFAFQRARGLQSPAARPVPAVP